MGAISTLQPKGTEEETELQELASKCEMWEEVALQKLWLPGAQPVPEQDKNGRARTLTSLPSTIRYPASTPHWLEPAGASGQRAWGCAPWRVPSWDPEQGKKGTQGCKGPMEPWTQSTLRAGRGVALAVLLISHIVFSSWLCRAQSQLPPLGGKTWHQVIVSQSMLQVSLAYAGKSWEPHSFCLIASAPVSINPLPSGVGGTSGPYHAIMWPTPRHTQNCTWTAGKGGLTCGSIP